MKTGSRHAYPCAMLIALVLLLPGARAQAMRSQSLPLFIAGGEPGEGRAQVWNRYGGSPFRVELRLPPGAEVLEIRPPVIDRVVLSRLPGAGTTPIVAITGDTVPVADRAIPGARLAFRVADADGASVNAGSDAGLVTLHIDQPTPVGISAHVWSRESFAADVTRDHVIRAALIGLTVAIMLHNLVIAAVARDMPFALNAACVGSLLGVDLYLNGYGSAYVWPWAPAVANQVLSVSLAAGLGFGCLFAQRFADRTEGPGGRLLTILAGSCLVLAPAGAIFDYWRIQPFLLLLTVCVVLSVVLVALGRARRGDRQARLLLMPMLFAMLPGTVIVIWVSMRGLSLAGFERHALEFVLATEAMLFSLATAVRIRVAEARSRADHAALLEDRAAAAARLIAAQDRERRRIAAELHDSTGQTLLYVSMALRRLGTTPKLAAIAERLRESIDEVRRISHDLHPAILDHLGWKRAIEQVFARLGEIAGVQAECRIEVDECALANWQQLHVYRIAQEAAANIARHAAASHCWLRLWAANGRIALEIGDDGRGMAASRHADSLGLSSIEERVRVLRGRSEIGAGPMGGTLLHVEFPNVSGR